MPGARLLALAQIDPSEEPGYAPLAEEGMRNRLTVIALAGWASGCGGPDGGFEGIWMLTLSPTVAGEPTTILNHNFQGVVDQPDDTQVGPWTFTTTGDQSDSIVIVEIFALDGRGEDEAVLVMDGEIFPGLETEEKGTWEFVWEGTSDAKNGQVHKDGYRYTRTDADVSRTVIQMTIDGSSASGTIDETLDQVVEYAESDTWDPMDNYLPYTQMPANFYLFDESGIGVSNDPDSSDCATDPCFLNIANSYSDSTSFTGGWTRYRDAGAFDSVDSVGQPYGTGVNPYYYYP